MATEAERARIDRLVRQHADLAIRLCDPYLGRGMIEPEDLAQAAMLGLTRAVVRCEDEATLAGYAVPYIVAAIRDEIRRARVIPVGERLARSGAEWPRIARIAEPDLVVDPASTRSHAVTDDAVAIEAALKRLRAIDRRALEVRFGLDGGPVRTLDQVGRKLGISRQAAVRRLARALQMLRAELQPKRTGGPDLRQAYA
jgi:RNA polymerase sigma factor (sigma-70 family)